MRFRKLEEIRRHFLTQHTSGLTIAAYCKRENISSSSWWYWRKRLQNAKPVSADHSVSPVSFLQLPMQALETPKFDCTLPNGVRLILPVSCDMLFLRKTIRMLAPLRPR